MKTITFTMWIARDDGIMFTHDKEIILYNYKPSFDKVSGLFTINDKTRKRCDEKGLDDYYCEILNRNFNNYASHLKPGECKQVDITIKEQVK